MAKKGKTKVEDLVGQFIRNELEAQLAKMVRKARRKAAREAGKLSEVLQLEYHEGQGFVEAEFQEVQPSEIGQPEVKKTGDGEDGQ